MFATVIVCFNCFVICSVAVSCIFCCVYLLYNRRYFGCLIFNTASSCVTRRLQFPAGRAKMFSSSCQVHDSELQDAFVIDVDISQVTRSELTLMTLKKCSSVLTYTMTVSLISDHLMLYFVICHALFTCNKMLVTNRILHS